MGVRKVEKREHPPAGGDNFPGLSKAIFDSARHRSFQRHVGNHRLDLGHLSLGSLHRCLGIFHRYFGAIQTGL
uniref:hypothetical protein n=1 Tax=Mesorhizobium atlanticum TaxID=2233532 RepID=UPI0037042F1C